MRNKFVFCIILLFAVCAWGQTAQYEVWTVSYQKDTTYIKMALDVKDSTWVTITNGFGQKTKIPLDKKWDMGRSFDRWLRLSDLVDYWDEYKKWAKVNPIKFATGMWTCIMDSISDGHIVGRNYPDSCTTQRQISAEDFIENFLRTKINLKGE